MEIKLSAIFVKKHAQRTYHVKFSFILTSYLGYALTLGMVNLQVKPLGVIWGKFPQYNKDNTIMFDDLRRNFLMNPFNGLKIRPFRNAHTSRSTDKELLKLSAYLKKISTLSSFETLDHKHWEKYLTKSQLKINTPSMHVVTNFFARNAFCNSSKTVQTNI